MGSAVPVLPKARPAGIRVPGNQSCRASGCWLQAGRLTPVQGPGMEGGPGRSPRAMVVPGTSGSAAVVATPRLQLSPRAAGERCGEGEGSGEGRGGARLSVPCACAEKRRKAPPVLLSSGSAPTGRLLRCWPPLRLAAGAKVHPRHAGRSSVPLGRLPAAGRLQLQARRGLGRGAPQTSRGSAPPRSMPGLPRPALLSGRPPSDASSPRALRRTARAPLSRAAAAAQVRDQLSLASSAPLGPLHPDPAS